MIYNAGSVTGLFSVCLFTFTYTSSLAQEYILLLLFCILMFVLC